MKKNAPKILAIVLLSTIAVLMVVAGSGSLAEVFAPKKDTTVSSAVGSVTPEANNAPLEVKAPTVHFPILSKEGERFAYEQSIETETELSLSRVHQTADGVFLIINHSSSSGVFAVDNKSISVVKADEKGNLTAVNHLSSSKDMDYLCSQITASGLVVVGTDGERCYVYTLAQDFSSVELVELPQATSARVFACSEGYLLLTEGKENAIFRIVGNAITGSNSLQAGSVKEIYGVRNGYTIFVNGLNGYSVLNVGEELQTLSSVTVPERRLVALQPYAESGTQKYIAAELSASGVDIVKYGAGFSVAEAEKVSVGLASDAEVFMNGESVFLLLHASTDRLYLVDKNLNFTASSSTLMSGVTEIFDCISHSTGYHVLYKTADGSFALELRNDGTTLTENLLLQASRGYALRTLNGKTAYVLQTASNRIDFLIK